MPFPGNQGFVEVFTFRPHVGGGRALYFEWAALILSQFNPFKSESYSSFELELELELERLWHYLRREQLIETLL